MQQIGNVIPLATGKPSQDSKPHCEMSDQMLAVFAGREFPARVLQGHKRDIDQAMKTDRFCPTCESLDDCVMDSPGWQVFFDERASDSYGRPMFRYGKCPLWREQEAEGQVKATLGRRFQIRSFDTWQLKPENEDAFDIARVYAHELTGETTKGLLLVGDIGTGKTHLAAAILKVAIGKGIRAAMVVVPKLLEEIRQTYNGEGDRRMAKRVRQTPFVVLDDLGAERPTEWVEEQLFLLINERYEQMLPTVCTSNCSMKGLEQRIGRRVVDRLMEMCMVVPMRGRSYRLGAGN